MHSFNTRMNLKYSLSPMGYYYDLDPVWLVGWCRWMSIDIITCLPWVALLTMSVWLVQVDDWTILPVSNGLQL